VWRYSRIDDLDLASYRLVDVSDRRPDVELGDLPLDLGASITVTVIDGRVDSIAGDEALIERGVVECASLPPVAPGLRESLGIVVTEAIDLFTDLNDAFAPDPLIIRIPAGTVLDEPLLVDQIITADGAAVFPRLIVQAGANSQFTVIERYRSADVQALVVPVVEIDVAPSARVTYAAVQELGPKVWQIASQVSRVAQEATFTSGTAALGGDYARLRTDCRLDGRGATGTLLAAYFGEGGQTLDFRTFQDHRAPDTTSTLLFKGAVGGASRSVYTGLIRVRPDAKGTNAFQTNRNIKLGPDAWAESVPNLQIENNDVRCSHASAVGPIDPEQRFYLESRGAPPADAERLIVAGFFEEVIAQLPTSQVGVHVRAAIAEKLDRSTS
jgi:Fe-S cluster assembly protein SufD